MDFEMFAYVGRKMRLCTLALAKQLGLARFEGSGFPAVGATSFEPVSRSCYV